MTLLRLSFSFVVIGLLVHHACGLPQDYTNTNLRANQPRRLIFPVNDGGGSNTNSLLSYSAQQQSVQQGIGGTGIACRSPGQFVPAPDGCNHCLCEQNGELGSACTRAFCPPGHPSGDNRQSFRL